MDKRMVQYDFSIALEHIGAGGLRRGGLQYPSSCLVNLRRRGPIGISSFPIRFGPLGEAIYGYVVLNAAEYSMDEIFHRHLLFLYPFYLMRYDSDTIADIAGDKSRTKSLLEECETMRRRLADETLKKGDEDRGLFKDLVSYAVRVSDKLFAEHEDLGRKVREAMGGEYVETFDEELMRKDKTIAEQHKTIAEQHKTIAEQHKTIEELRRLLGERVA